MEKLEIMMGYVIFRIKTKRSKRSQIIKKVLMNK